MTNVKSIYGLENQFSNNKFIDNTIQFVHKTWSGVWVVIAVSSIYTLAKIKQHAKQCLKIT